MKARRVPIGTLILSGFVILVGTYATVPLAPVTGISPTLFFFYPVIYLIFLSLISRQTLILKDRGASEMLMWAAAFSFYVCFLFLISSQSKQASFYLRLWLSNAAFVFSFVLILSRLPKLDSIHIAFAVIALFSVAMNFYDFFQPTFSNVPGRAAGFYENPNIAGEFIAFSMVAAVPVIPRKLRLWFIVLCGLGILVTFSRNSWLLWGIGVVFLGWTGELGATRYRKVAVFLASLIGAGALALLFTGSLGQMVASGPLAEYLGPNTMARLGVGGAQAQFNDSSANERRTVAIAAFEEGARKPLFGNGLAYTKEPGGWDYQASTHNMYLLFWAEGGLFGLVLYVWFVVMLWRHGAGVGRALALQIMIDGLFTHNQLDQPAVLIFPAFVIAHGQLSRRQRLAMPRIRRAAYIA